MTSAARLVKGQHPYTGTGGPATVPAPLQEDINTITNIQRGLGFIPGTANACSRL